MKTSAKLGLLACLLTAASGASPALGQAVLYTQNFDVDGQAALWTLVDGPTDESADYFFDYNSVGIPPAPNSGGTTRGLKVQANMIDGVFGGSSTSPNGQSFSGDYAVTFDLWTNYLGGDPAGVGVIGSTTGSTMLSLYGIETSGTVANRAGVTDGIFFANTGDTSSTAFRAYSAERPVSYQTPPDVGYETDVLDGIGQPVVLHATYHAGNRSNNPNSTTAPAAQLYIDTFPSVTVPAAQTALFPETQHASTVAGSVGFAWHEVEIAKVGNTVTWKVDGVLLITLDKTNFVTPTGGTNIFFGHGDVNAGISLDPYYPLVSFTLIDNIAVTAVAPVTDDADFDGDDDVDGADFLIWQKNLGTGNSLATGDANGDMAVNDLDLAIWSDQYGTGGAPAGAIPEPASAGLALAAALGLSAARSRRGASRVSG